VVIVLLKLQRQAFRKRASQRKLIEEAAIDAGYRDSATFRAGEDGTRSA
jgi:hypothetical protein